MRKRLKKRKKRPARGLSPVNTDEAGVERPRPPRCPSPPQLGPSLSHCLKHQGGCAQETGHKCNQCELATIHIGNMRMHMKSPQCSNLPQPQALPQASRILCSRITVSLHPSMKAAYEDAHEKTQRKDSKREGEIVLGVPTWDSHHTPAAWVKPHCLKYWGCCAQELVESSSSDEKA